MFYYNRTDAVNYALEWALKRNPAYYDFDGLGGDCTNFVSQCIYAGAKVMNYGGYGWYYINANNRSASWTGVDFLYNFLISNKGGGPYARLCGINGLLPADTVQLKRKGRWIHSLFVTEVKQPYGVYVSAHTYDSLNKPLDSYWYDDIRCLHIEGVRK